MRRSAAPSARIHNKRLCFLPSSKVEIKENDILQISNLDPPCTETTRKKSSFCYEETVKAFSLFEEKENAVCSTDEILKLMLEPTQIVDESPLKTSLKILEDDNPIENASCFQESEGSEPSLSKPSEKSDENETPTMSCPVCTCVSDKKISFSVLWCKRSSKKHKVWEGDGILMVSNRSASLKDLDGKIIDRGIGYKLKEVEDLEEGSKFFIGGKECEIQSKISENEDTAIVCNCAKESVPVKSNYCQTNLKKKVCT